MLRSSHRSFGDVPIPIDCERTKTHSRHSLDRVVFRQECPDDDIGLQKKLSHFKMDKSSSPFGQQCLDDVPIGEVQRLGVNPFSEYSLHQETHGYLRPTRVRRAQSQLRHLRSFPVGRPSCSGHIMWLDGDIVTGDIVTGRPH